MALNGKLIKEGGNLGGHKSKKEAVTAALCEYTHRRKQLQVIQLFGTVDYEPNYSYRIERTARKA